MNIRKIFLIIGILILLVILYYFYFGSQLGIGVSCKEKEILEIRKIPPPLMAISQPTFCQVEIIAMVEDEVLCYGKIDIKNIEKGIFPCPKIKDYPNSYLNISAIFYDSDGKLEIGRDNKILFNP